MYFAETLSASMISANRFSDDLESNMSPFRESAPVGKMCRAHCTTAPQVKADCRQP